MPKEPIRFHAQCGEDKWIMDNLAPAKGIFVEVGSFDGVVSSNTICWEDMGWSGVLIEADPYLASASHELRRAPTVCAAVGELGVKPFFINHQDRGLSGLTRKGDPVPVPVLPLCTILAEMFIQHVNILSIDTEGTELDVWATRGRYQPDIVIMEHQTCEEPSNRDAIIKRLNSDGYTLVHETMYNLIFKNYASPDSVPSPV